jgi:hypothetical protein
MRLALPFLIFATAAPALGAQDSLGVPWTWSARIEAGTLNARDPFDVTMAVGGSFGLVNARNGFFVRYTRQQHDRNQVPYFNDVARHFWTLEWEHAFAAAQPFRQQVMLRLGAGVLGRGASQLKRAAVVTVGATVRYPVGRFFSFVGTFADQMADLPRQDFTNCYQGWDYNAGQPVQVCESYRYGGELQHNFGLFIAFEVRP